MGFAAVARVTDERWVCRAIRDDIAFGLRPRGELKPDTPMCHEIRQRNEAMLIGHDLRNPPASVDAGGEPAVEDAA